MRPELGLQSLTTIYDKTEIDPKYTTTLLLLLSKLIQNKWNGIYFLQVR